MNNGTSLSRSQKRRARLVSSVRAQSAARRAVVVSAAKNARSANTEKNRRRRQRKAARFRADVIDGVSAFQPETQNTYLRSLQNPEEIWDAKVPDLTAIPTGVFQTETVITLQSGNQGLVALAAFPHTNGAATAINYTDSGVVLDPNNIVYGLSKTWNGTTEIQATYSHIRPVSGSMIIESAGSESANQGMITGYWRARGLTKPTSLTQADSMIQSNTSPVKYGMRILWRPMDNADAEFTHSATEANRPYLGFVANALGVGQALRITIRFNYEGIPTSDHINLVNASPSPVNLHHLSQAFSWAQFAGDKIKTLVPYATAALNVAGATAKAYLGRRGLSTFGKLVPTW